MWGIFRFSSRGVIFSTSPAIQLKPSVVTCSLPRVAINCMPTQMPKNGRAFARPASIDRRLIVAEGALLCGPAIEEAPLGSLLIVGNHDVELTPVAPGQGPAL